MDTGQWIAIILSAVLGVWFVIGSMINRRRGVDTYKWLKQGLETLGKVTEGRWIGSSGSGARLIVGEAKKPFKRIEVVFLLDSREIMPLWLFNLVRGKQDEMILKANLRSRPTQEIEAVRQRGWNFPRTGAASNDLGMSPAGFRLNRRGPSSEGELARVRAFLEQYQESVRSLSLQKKEPHLILRINLPGLRSETADIFFKELQNWLGGGTVSGI